MEAVVDQQVKLARIANVVTVQFDVSHPEYTRLIESVGRFRFQQWRTANMNMSNTLKAQTWIEAQDELAWHWLSSVEGQVIASARLSIHNSLSDLPEGELYKGLDDLYPQKIASFNRLIVDEGYRGLGVAANLVQCRIEQAAYLGAKSIALDCPQHRVKAMQQVGFETVKAPQVGTKCPDIMWYPMRKLL
ncbi:hypothetical protein C2869_21020 [Saccharobesus litoralis]|uniref:N-acetyltransferase domain-containing protein n=1 Tax=Saccharobesus litoralis TaxID=2172099 RepID=A0A2S0VWX7_9ALTE|nr:GNAT family N-acetyltransferase [Saccharobesus litoralis]AWB68724.1 hypothetical protein C2869_21020 [Saccharobesus litoralis]